MFYLIFVVLPILAIALPVLNALGVINIRWTLALSPILVPVGMFVLLVLVIFVILMIVSVL
jgi:hypothetical protein